MVNKDERNENLTRDVERCQGFYTRSRLDILLDSAIPDYMLV